MRPERCESSSVWPDPPPLIVVLSLEGDLSGRHRAAGGGVRRETQGLRALGQQPAGGRGQALRLALQVRGKAVEVREGQSLVLAV